MAYGKGDDGLQLLRELLAAKARALSTHPVEPGGTEVELLYTCLQPGGTGPRTAPGPPASWDAGSTMFPGAGDPVSTWFLLSSTGLVAEETALAVAGARLAPAPPYLN